MTLGTAPTSAPLEVINAAASGATGEESRGARAKTTSVPAITMPNRELSSGGDPGYWSFLGQQSGADR